MRIFKEDKRKISVITLLIIMAMICFVGCTNSGDTEANGDAEGESVGVEISVSAAASLTDALQDIATLYEENSNDSILFNFAGSGTLAKQIEEGAPCDIFISASQVNMDTLEEGNIILSETRKDLLGNTLTLIAAKEKADVINSIEDVTSENIGSIAVGTPETVPAGRYAKESFESLDIWEETQPKMVFAKDVRQVLEYVETGNADCGLVYKSDAVALETGIVVMDMPEDSHTPIVYPLAMIAEIENTESVEAFYTFIQSEEAIEIFERYGFKAI